MPLVVPGSAPEPARGADQPLPVAAVFHGHAHNGSLEGRTSADVPVYNVSVPVFQRRRPGADEFRVVEPFVSE